MTNFKFTILFFYKHLGIQRFGGEFELQLSCNSINLGWGILLSASMSFLAARWSCRYVYIELCVSVSLCVSLILPFFFVYKS